MVASGRDHKCSSTSVSLSFPAGSPVVRQEPVSHLHASSAGQQQTRGPRVEMESYNMGTAQIPELPESRKSLPTHVGTDGIRNKPSLYKTIQISGLLCCIS